MITAWIWILMAACLVFGLRTTSDWVNSDPERKRGFSILCAFLWGMVVLIPVAGYQSCENEKARIAQQKAEQRRQWREERIKEHGSWEAYEKHFAAEQEKRRKREQEEKEFWAKALAEDCQKYWNIAYGSGPEHSQRGTRQYLRAVRFWHKHCQ